MHCVLCLLHCLVFSPIEVTQADDHMRGHPWGLLLIQSENFGCEVLGSVMLSLYVPQVTD